MARTKSYGQLTDAEKWQWHADVYAFRRIVLEVPPDEQTSPCDPGGEWLNEELIRAAAARLQLRRDRGRMERKRVLDEQRHREGRALCDAWARKRGYADFATAEKAGVKWSEVAASFGSIKTIPGERYTKAADLGVTAREKTWTAEEMARGRRELGLEPDEAA